jgi:hypothetical protein
MFVDTCKIHGKLKGKQIYAYKKTRNATKFYFRCRICYNISSGRYKRKRNSKKYKTELILSRIKSSNPVIQGVLERIVRLIVDTTEIKY